MTNKTTIPLTNNDSGMTSLQTELQEVRLALADAQDQIARLNRDLEGLRLRQAEQQREAAQSQMEFLFREAAGPVAQLAVQAYLLESNKPVQARDVLAITKRLQRVLEKHGLAMEGTPSTPARFDPNHHAPLSGGIEIQSGLPVIIRVPGVTYQGEVMAHALVEPAEDDV